MNCYIWIIVFALMIAAVLLPLWQENHLMLEQLLKIGLFSAALNTICAGILGLGVENNSFSVKSLIFYFVGNYLAAIILKKKVMKWSLPDRQIAAKYLVFCTPIICFSLIELIFSGAEAFSVMELQYKLINIAILYAVFIIVYYILFPYKATLILYTLLGVIYSIVNFYVAGFRNGNAILPSEIFAIKTALNVSGNYSVELANQIPALLLGTLAFLGIIIYLPNPKYKKRSAWKRIVGSLGLMAIVGLGYGNIDFCEKFRLNLNYWDISQSYSEYGTPLTFLTLCQNMSVDKPEGYSAEEAEDVLDRYDAQTVDQNAEINERPTVIAIMNESFSDLNIIRGFETNPDYLSFWKSFEEPAVKGNLLVPVYGGGTCNTEFEFLTGLSMGNLPRGIYPYQMYDLSGVESLPRLFGKLGYDTLAIHPGKEASWNRAQAFAALGFDDFISEEDFDAEESDYLRGFISDAACYEKLIEAYENRENEMFIFCVTIQNHGGYENITFDGDNLLSLEGNLDQYNDAKEYLSLVKVSDDELEKLFDYFSNIDEPVVICVFGDHQPGLNGDFYDELYGKASEYLTTEEKAEKYMTPYLIWANYDMGQAERYDTSANFLGSVLLEKAKLPQDPINVFLLEMFENVPMMNPDYVKTVDGKWFNLTEYRENGWIQKYSLLQYYEMFEKDEG